MMSIASAVQTRRVPRSVHCLFGAMFAHTTRTLVHEHNEQWRPLIGHCHSQEWDQPRSVLGQSQSSSGPVHHEPAGNCSRVTVNYSPINDGNYGIEKNHFFLAGPFLVLKSKLARPMPIFYKR